MPVLEDAARPFSDVEHVGLALCRGPVGLHSGILYKLAEEKPRILHLAFHEDLQDDEAGLPFRWAELGLDEVNKEILAQILVRIAYRKPAIAYGFDADGVSIDPDTGDVRPGPPGKGLTCATFVTAVLKAHGFELVEMASWPHREDDIPFHNQIVGFLEKRKAKPEHIDAVRRDVGARRLRPDEVVGAGNLPDEQWLVPFEIARSQADVVQDDLAAH